MVLLVPNRSPTTRVTTRPTPSPLRSFIAHDRRKPMT